MSSQPTKPKGILKKSNIPPTETNPDKPVRDPREIAIQQARRIHSRREVEDDISESLIILSRFPPTRSGSHSASRPAPADADAFKQLVRLYQPSDYDDMVEERNCNDLCGYALCPRPRSRLRQGNYKMMNWGHADFAIVPKAEYEKWCCQACAKRAMYVKVQLNETGAWERAGIESIGIELYEDPTQANDSTAQLTKEVKNLKLDADEKAAQNAQDLALERGDIKTTSKRSVPVKVREKTVKMTAEAPSLTAGDDDGHAMLEGYKTKFDPRSELINGVASINLSSETVAKE
ncbi:Rtr1/RPAP2 family-domain-containing protein [Xylariaceae sp. FL0016]|nr:Rtr1/RPAP2 family-domain-containing protein [Xylariaceae sp. FL0016]